MQELHLSLLAILGAAVARFFIGFIWHAVLPFGKSILKELGETKKQMKARQGKGLPVDFIAGLLMAFVLAHAIRYAGAQGMTQGMMVGFWNWLGFIATGLIAEVVWHGRSMNWFLFTGGYYLVSLLAMGAILVTWA